MKGKINTICPRCKFEVDQDREEYYFNTRPYNQWLEHAACAIAYSEEEFLRKPVVRVCCRTDWPNKKIGQ